jgi:hypothetical protein
MHVNAEGPQRAYLDARSNKDGSCDFFDNSATAGSILDKSFNCPSSFVHKSD